MSNVRFGDYLDKLLSEMGHWDLYKGPGHNNTSFIVDPKSRANYSEMNASTGQPKKRKKSKRWITSGGS
jgi:hypothetical protein